MLNKLKWWFLRLFKVRPPCGRSPLWGKVRDKFIKEHPTCELCNGKTDLVAHHIKPYHLFPEEELNPSNLITLCEREKYGVNCHLLFGHFGNWKKYNINVRQDVKTWNSKINGR